MRARASAVHSRGDPKALWKPKWPADIMQSTASARPADAPAGARGTLRTCPWPVLELTSAWRGPSCDVSPCKPPVTAKAALPSNTGHAATAVTGVHGLTSLLSLSQCSRTTKSRSRKKAESRHGCVRTRCATAAARHMLRL